MPPQQETVQVMLRIRPPAWYSVYPDAKEPNVLHCGEKIYVFDHIFTAQSTDQEIFEKVGLEMVDNALEGYNNTLFVYGQTGTGKTYTMSGTNKDDGLIQRCVKSLRKKAQEDSKFQNYTIKMSYLQIYNEQVRDLLTGAEKVVREQAKIGFYVEGLSEVHLDSYQDFLKNFKKGTLARWTKPTQMNQISSRSHSILTIIVQTKQQKDGNTLIKTSKMNFVDLAGSEKLRQTGASGERKTEAAHINLSLTTLRKVINTLEKKKGKQTVHVPYRQSVLTKILKDSLGGNSHTTIIGTISAKSECIPETISTLNFLEGAKQVKNETKANQKIEGDEQKLKQLIQTYEQKISKLEEELSQAKIQLQNAKVLEEKYLDQIKIYQERILLYETPKGLFDDNDQNDFFSNLNIEKQLSFRDGLKTITENFSQFTGFSQDLTQEMNQKLGEVQSQKMLSVNGISRSDSRSLEVDPLMKMQISYLKQKLQKYEQQSEEYDKLLQLIEKNLQNLKFSQAQLQLMNLNSKQTFMAEQYVKDAESHSTKLLAVYEQQKAKYLKLIEDMKKLDFDNISKQSSYRSVQKNLQQEIENLKVQLEQQRNELVCSQQEYKTQIIKLKEQLSEERRQKDQACGQVIVLRKEVQNLNQTLSFHDQCTRNLMRQIEATLNQEKRQAILQMQAEKGLLINESESKLSIFFQQAESQLNSLNQENQNLKQKIVSLEQNRLSLLHELQEVQQQLKHRENSVQELQLDYQIEQQKVKHKNEELNQLRQMLREIKNQSNKFQVDGEEVTSDELIKMYTNANVQLLQLISENKSYKAKEMQFRNKLEMSQRKISAIEVIIANSNDIFAQKTRAYENLISKLQQQVNVLKSERNQLRLQVIDDQKLLEKSSQQQLIRQYKQNVQQLRLKVNELKEVLKKMKKISTQQIQKYYRSYKVKSIQLKEQQLKNRQLHDQIKTLKNEIAKCQGVKGQIKKMIRKNRTLEQIIKQLEKKYFQAKTKIEELESNKKENASNNNELKKQLTDLKLSLGIEKNLNRQIMFDNVEQKINQIKSQKERPNNGKMQGIKRNVNSIGIRNQ